MQGRNHYQFNGHFHELSSWHYHFLRFGKFGLWNREKRRRCGRWRPRPGVYFLSGRHCKIQFRSSGKTLITTLFSASIHRSLSLQLFSVLFFLMLFTLGIGSAVSLIGGVVTIICDAFPTWKRWLVTAVVCFASFLAGLVYVTPVIARSFPLITFRLKLVSSFGPRAVYLFWKSSTILEAVLSSSSWPLFRLSAFVGSTVRFH